jgi:predicted nucleotidyltransferase
MEPSEVERLVREATAEHGCHTTILYGSYARGDATKESDVDVLCVREGGATVRDARVVDGVYLDAFVYPESAVATPDPALLRILGGRVIVERDGFGTALLASVRAFHDRGPLALPDDERQALRVWSQKTLERARADHGLEGSYRRTQLVLQALEDYFALRNSWFLGSKWAFAWLAERDAAVHSSFERVLCDGAGDEAFTELVQRVYVAAG